MSFINTPPASSQVRQPRALLALGDVLIDFESVTITHSGTFQAGSFQAIVRSAPGGNVGEWNWWLDQSVVTLDLYAGFPADPSNYGTADLTRMFTVRIDQIDLDVATNKLTLQGRDLTAILIDTKTSGQFQNQTSSQVAQSFATQAGLTANIQPTTAKIGTYYAQDHVRVMREQTQWALLTYLARKEGVQCFVLGRTLYFGQFANLKNQQYLITFNPATADQPYPTSSALKLEFIHDLTLARDIIVTVRSWNLKNKKGFTVTAKTTSGASLAAKNLTPVLPASSAAAQAYAYTIPNLTPIAAQQKAQELLQEISKHELRMNAALPGDDLLYPWVQVQVQGTQTIFDTTFYPSDVTRTITPSSFVMSLRAKNHPTGTQVQIT